MNIPLRTHFLHKSDLNGEQGKESRIAHYSKDFLKQCLLQTVIRLQNHVC